MSSTQSKILQSDFPRWFVDLLTVDVFDKPSNKLGRGNEFSLTDGVLRANQVLSLGQHQTKEVFGFKWEKRDTFENPAPQSLMEEWSNDRYNAAESWFPKGKSKHKILDAGCGAAHTGLLYFKTILNDIQYIGADISTAVDVAKTRMESAGADASFIQCDLLDLPIKSGSLDGIFSEGVLHHTDSTKGALMALAPLLKSGGLFMFYVYKQKGPVREFTDDFIREKLQDLSPEEAWRMVEPISKFGQVLGDLDIKIDVPERIDLLDIDAGQIDLQRFFYWHIFKCFYRPDFSLEEMNHINFDWFAPKNAFRQTPEQVRGWCDEAGLIIEREKIEEAGITIVARKT